MNFNIRIRVCGLGVNIFKSIFFVLLLSLSSLWLFIDIGDVEIKFIDYEFIIPITHIFACLAVILILVFLLARIEIFFSRMRYSFFFRKVVEGFINFQRGDYNVAKKSFYRACSFKIKDSFLCDIMIAKSIVHIGDYKRAKIILLKLAENKNVRAFALASLAEIAIHEEDWLGLERIVGIFESEGINKEFVCFKEKLLLENESWNELSELYKENGLYSFMQALSMKSCAARAIDFIKTVKNRIPQLAVLEADIYLQSNNKDKALNVIKKSFYLYKAEHRKSIFLLYRYLQLDGELDDLDASNCDIDIIIALAMMKKGLYSEAYNILNSLSDSLYVQIKKAELKARLGCVEETINLLAEINPCYFFCSVCGKLTKEFNLKCSCGSLGKLQEVIL